MAANPGYRTKEQITGADCVVGALLEHNVPFVTGVTGGAIMKIYDAIGESGIRVIDAAQEGGAGHLAEGYAMATGRPGVVVVTSGPGFTNVVTPLYDAYMDSVPLIVISGQVAASAIGTDAFQEVDAYGLSLPIVKHSYLVKDARDLPQVMVEAFYLATNNRPGPVHIDIPKDVAQCLLGEIPEIDYSSNAFNHNPITRLNGELEDALEMLYLAERPVVYIGGGVITARAANIADLVRKLNIPAVTTLKALGALPYDKLNLGMPGMHGTAYANYALGNADTILVLGSRLDDRVVSNLEQFAVKRIIHVDIDPTEIDKRVIAVSPFHADVGEFITAMLARAQEGSGRYHDWHAQIAQWREQFPMEFHQGAGVISPQYPIAVLDEILRNEDAIITTGVGQHQMFAAQYFHPRGQRRFLTSGGAGTMGFGFPAALGAKLAHPERIIVDIDGDGSFLMNVQELATAHKHNIPVKAMVLTNGAMGMVRQWQTLFFNQGYVASHLGTGGYPDFSMIAQGFGIPGRRISRPEDVQPAIEEMLGATTPYVLEILVDKDAQVLPMVPPGKRVDSDMITIQGARERR